jgi:GNAT superfamily N-acetyltransferase
MGSLGLPSKNSPDISLQVATPAEHDAQVRDNSVEWKGVLNRETYCLREKHLASQDLTRDGGLTPWVLVYQPDGSHDRQVLCGCETIRKRAMIARDGKVNDGLSHAVGSVFCPPEFRGRGYAGRMVEELGKKLENWQTEPGESALFSLLYSDIGKQFYAVRGWHPFASAEISLPVAENPVPEGVRLLRSEDLDDLCALDERILRTRLAAHASSSSSPNHPVVALAPDRQTAAWHHAREEFVGTRLYGKAPTIKGAMVGETPGARVWAYWSRFWLDPETKGPNPLHILRVVVEDDALADFAAASPEGVRAVQDTAVVRALAAIFAVAQSEAARWDMGEVVVWNPTAVMLAAAQVVHPDVSVRHRETDCIPSLRGYGEGAGMDVDWVENMKYGWC